MTSSDSICGTIQNAETAEREAERRYPAEPLEGWPRTMAIGSQRAFIAGATWQREQSALSGREREEVLRAIAPFDLAWIGHPVLSDSLAVTVTVIGTAHETQITVEQWRALTRLAARLRSAPSEADDDGCCGQYRWGGGVYCTACPRPPVPDEPKDATPSPAPEQRAETAMPLAWGSYPSHEGERIIGARFLATEPDALGHAILDRMKAAWEADALPHSAPAADTVAVPRETLEMITHGDPATKRWAAAEITRLLGETP